MIRKIIAASTLSIALAGMSGAANAQDANGQPAPATARGENVRTVTIRGRVNGTVTIGGKTDVPVAARNMPLIHDDHYLRPSCPSPASTAIANQPCVVTGIDVGVVTNVTIGTRRGTIGVIAAPAW